MRLRTMIRRPNPCRIAEGERGRSMKRFVTVFLAILGCFAIVGSALATQETKDLARERKIFRNFSGEGSASISSLCVEGHVFVLVSGNLSNQSTLTQVYEEREGKVVPKRCEAN